MKKFLWLAGTCILAIALLSWANQRWQKDLPTVVEIKAFKNGAKDIDPKLSEINLRFSEPMDTRYSGFDLGPLGKEHLFKVKKFAFSEDEINASFAVDLEPNKHYQVLVTTSFRNRSGVRIAPYLIEFWTGE
ncbi:MAG: hypothetical protein AB8G15_23020 [Saprospiraceae bacterium]